MDEDDKRGESRHRTLKAGLIVFNEGRSTIGCTVRNLSPAGARLEVASPLGIPDRFVLAIGAERHAATVRWRRETAIGVAFAPD